MRFLSALAVFGLGTGCLAMLPAPTPMTSIHAEREAGKPHRCLLVVLPGRGDHAQDFVSHGFVDALRKRPIAADVVVAEAVYGYYAKRTLIPRLQEDVIDPARARGYEQVWIAGISMGGLGSLLYAKAKPGGVAGIALFAPFVGDQDVIDEIRAAGGPAAWKPGNISEDDYQRELWRWLQGVLAKDDPKISLAFGEQDRMVSAHRLLASALPKERVLSTAGGHDWPTWAKLWDSFLDGSDFARACSDPSP